jgi:hypothetical protein
MKENHRSVKAVGVFSRPNCGYERVMQECCHSCLSVICRSKVLAVEFTHKHFYKKHEARVESPTSIVLEENVWFWKELLLMQ